MTATTRLQTERLDLVPMTLSFVEALLAQQRDEMARLISAELPVGWPTPTLVSRAYGSIEGIRAAPEDKLWGDRIVLLRGPSPRLIGSVVFHGCPDAQGEVEIAYGIEPRSQGCGFAREATRVCLGWALDQPGVKAVTATTPPWHKASVRVLEHLGMKVEGSRDHEMLGELLCFAVRR